MNEKNEMDIIYEDECQADEKLMKARSFCHEVRKLAKNLSYHFL